MNLKEKANQIRQDVIDVAVRNRAGHIAPSLSTVEILTAIYYSGLYVFDKNDWHNRTRVVLSKGHGCYALYSILADKGIIPMEEWKSFYKGSQLTGCVSYKPEWGLEAGCGSLGHGLPMAVGIAYSSKLQNLPWHTICIVGDGELQEGSCWEALRFAGCKYLNNLTVIVDNNNLQAMDNIYSVMESVEDGCGSYNMLEACGFSVSELHGHDLDWLIKELSIPNKRQPKAIYATTFKGNGLKCMFNTAKFHFRVPTEEELAEGAWGYGLS